MKIGIYNEPSGIFGGSEYVVAVMAHALAARHQVEIVHHNPALALDDLRELSGLDLPGVTLRCVEREPPVDLRGLPGLRRLPRAYRIERAWHAALSRPYDVFVNSTHGVPPFSHARRGVLLTLFPAHERRNLWPWNLERSGPTRGAAARVRRAWFDWMWRRRFASYRHRLAISHYTHTWTKAWWGIDTQVLYPPVDTSFPAVPKGNLVLSVGRFSTCSHSKRQVEMMRAYRDLKPSAREWCYFSVGGLTDHPADRAYFEEAGQIAGACGGRVMANVPRPKLRELFATAKIFWHAAGYGADPHANPFEAEHFGIATVEAMAAGAVPIVFDHGGQREIVEHGRSGFLWKTLDELRDHTLRLIRDDQCRERMSQAARQRAVRFSRETFVAALPRLVE